MSIERRLTGMIAAAAVLVVLFVIWDAFKPEPRIAPEPDVVVAAPVPPPPLPVPPPSSSSLGTAGGTQQTSYIEQLARSENRRRIRNSAGSTYLNEMIASTGDSMLRRWDNRTNTPVRVWFASTRAANFQPAFLDAIRSSFMQWTSAGVPVRFDFSADSTSAEVVVRWKIQFEIERTGQTDLTWDENGRVQSAVITLATFDPMGRPMDAEDIRVVALHEAGHLLGLDHSPDSTDMMFPTARVKELSDRDVRTVLLLYQLTPGSLR